MTKRERTSRLAVALRSTTDRYLDGLIGRRTWKSHMTALLAQAADHGILQAAVEAMFKRRRGVRR